MVHSNALFLLLLQTSGASQNSIECWSTTLLTPQRRKGCLVSEHGDVAAVSLSNWKLNRLTSRDIQAECGHWEPRSVHFDLRSTGSRSPSSGRKARWESQVLSLRARWAVVHHNQERARRAVSALHFELRSRRHWKGRKERVHLRVHVRNLHQVETLSRHSGRSTDWGQGELNSILSHSVERNTAARFQLARESRARGAHRKWKRGSSWAHRTCWQSLTSGEEGFSFPLSRRLHFEEGDSVSSTLVKGVWSEVWSDFVELSLGYPVV